MSWMFKELSHAQLYTRYRPVYPSSVYSAIMNFMKSGKEAAGSRTRNKLALDIGCGSGQSTLPLSKSFDVVVGVDSSEAQLIEARKASEGHSNISYRMSVGHELPFQADGTVDLITVAQALHWFHADKFYPECHRVLRSNGVLAAYGYGVPEIKHTEAHSVLMKFYTETLNGYWEAGRSHIDDRYTRLYTEFTASFPQSIRDDTLALEKYYSVDDFMGYLSSWSGYQKYRKQNASSPDPLDSVALQFQKIYADNSEEKPMQVVSPIFLLLGRNS